VDWRDRAARNEEIYRNVNERIESTARDHGFDQELSFHCECAESDCFQTIQMPADDYDRIAADRFRFVVVPEHQNEAIEKIVLRTPAYLVVEKVGEARRKIERDHPRPRHADD
jgi:hypothetical protein